MLECWINVIADASPHFHVPRIIGLRRSGFFVENPVLRAAEEERPIVVAPHEHRIDVRQPAGQPEIGQWLRETGIQSVEREAIVLLA